MKRPFASWNNLSLAAQFAVAGGIVMILSMILIGRVVASRIEEGVVRNSAYATSQYMDSIVSPLSQDLAELDALSPVARRALDEIFAGTLLGKRVVSFKLWKPGGLVVHSRDESIVGRRFEVTEDLAAAYQGEVRAAYEDLSDTEDAAESAMNVPLLEIYSPVREVWSGRVIGVAEFYEVATELESELSAAKRNSWSAVALTFLSIGTLLYLIVLRGSRTIDRQSEALKHQLEELGALSAHNERLRERVQQAAARASAMYDQSLRRIGADLHDGPAQLLSYAALRLDALRGQVTDTDELETVERAVKDAIREVRSISKGLSLPEIAAREPCEIVRGVVEAHRARTGTDVDVDCAVPRGTVLPDAVKICIYRFVQEGLNNAWRYAAGDGQSVRLTQTGASLTLMVRDAGPGVRIGADGLPEGTGDDFSGMGLSGLRDRVESLGGTFTVAGRADGPGTVLKMELETGWT